MRCIPENVLDSPPESWSIPAHVHRMLIAVFRRIANKCVAVAVTAHIIKCVASSPDACSIPAHEAFLKKYGQVQRNVTNYEIYGLVNILCLDPEAASTAS